MSKSYLIVENEPGDCEGCIIRCSGERCPLKPIPRKKIYPSMQGNLYKTGWNACLDEMMKEK